MFDLVDRCEDYPQYLPWCGGAEIVRESGEELTATLLIDYHGIKRSFTTRNRHQQPTPATGGDQGPGAPGRIDIVLKDGPFAHLEGHWLFVPLAQGACRVEFSLDYAFASAMLGTVLAPVFGKISANFVDAFVKRAEEIYS